LKDELQRQLAWDLDAAKPPKIGWYGVYIMVLFGFMAKKSNVNMRKPS
jgi:hypothetical protein